MARKARTVAPGRRVSAAFACASVAVLALGGTALAAVTSAPEASFATFTPASVAPRLAQLLAQGDDESGLMRFTPAGAASRTGRSITVAVRIDDDTARAMSVRSAIAAASEQLAGSAPIEIASTRYDLGMARGYESFAQAKPAAPVAVRVTDIEMPDLAAFRPSEGARDKPSRFSARVALERDPKTGRAPNTVDALGDQTVDLGGAVRVTRNFDVTAGVRYSQERDPLDPLTDGSKQDSQAVYLGTQLRF